MKVSYPLACIIGSLFLAFAGCERAPTREAALHALVTTQLVPDMSALCTQSAALSHALQALAITPSSEAVQTARLAFRDALLAWDRVYALRLGPIVDNSGLLRARFWPIRERALVAAMADAAPWNDERVEQLGVDMRGLYAIEHLLFAVPGATLVDADSQAGKHLRAAALAFAKNVQRYADEAMRTLGDGAALSRSLSAAPQESVSRIVNQLSATVETLASDRVAPVLEMHAHKNVRASEVLGSTSGSSRELVLAQLRASERLYVGADPRASLSALVSAVAPEIDERVRARFVKARTRMEQVDGPLEQVVLRDRAHLEDAFRAFKELESALKVDLASALGVTMTFTAGDGD